MASFASLLSSISGQPAATPQPRPPTASKPNGVAPARPQALSNGVGAATNTAAGVKRKAEDQAAPEKAKAVKTEGSVPARPPGQSIQQPSIAKPAPSSAAGTYRGTARATGVATPAKAVPKPIPRPVNSASTSTTAPPAATGAATNGGAKPKRGFAALMERAKAAQQVVKAAGSSTIKHKPVEKLSKRERARMEEGKSKIAAKTGKQTALDRSRSNTPMDGKAGAQKKTAEPSYKGTMGKKPVVRQESTYKGTMNKAGTGNFATKQTSKYSSGRGKYDGYVDWDELDDAEDDEEEPYESDESDMMDAGFDDMEREDAAALRAARKEDQEALEEEERHKREKLERKRKLEALSKSAAARKKY